MTRRAVMAMLLAIATSRTPPVAERWELEIRGQATVEHGELRFDQGSGRVVLESADSFFVPLARLERHDSIIRFELSATQRRFTGSVSGNSMHGTMLDLDGTRFTWNADRILPGMNRWPVPPRITVRQLESGSDAATVKVSGAWRAAMPSSSALLDEYDVLTRAAYIAPWHGALLRDHTTSIQLGTDDLVRESVRRTLAEIARSPAANQAFQQIFQGTHGWRTDLHAVALEFAPRFKPDFRLDSAMVPIWRLTPGSIPPLDSASLREISWRFWSRFRNDSSLRRAFDSVAVSGGEGSLDARALLRAYDDAARWWDNALSWLMENRWIHDASGYHSPEELVRGFWGSDTLRVPEIVVSHFGSPEAFPASSFLSLLPRLVKPANAVAEEWLADHDGREVIDAWRILDWGEPFRVINGGHSRYLTSPAVEGRTHAGGLLAMDDRILIDPGVSPLLAVATVTHEWQHLIFSRRRLRLPGAAVLENSDEIRIREEDPWLAEGAAEWATDLILAPCRTTAPLLLAISASRRLAIQELTSDDPHILGYRLVRAAARHGTAVVMRDRLVRLLHDLPAVGRESGLAGPSTLTPMVLVRPVNAAVIPEVTFVYDGGAALDVHRRLRVSLSPLEH